MQYLARLLVNTMNLLESEGRQLRGQVVHTAMAVGAIVVAAGLFLLAIVGTTDEGQSQLVPWPEGSAIGKYVETLKTGGGDPNQPDALMGTVPEEYRLLFGRYLQRIAEDEAKANSPQTP